MRNFKKFTALMLTVFMIFSLMACGNSNATLEGAAETQAENSGTDSTSESADSTETPAAGDSGYMVGYNYFGTGGYSLAALANNSQIVLDTCGDKSQSADDQFSVENIVTDVENMIQAGCNGIIIWLPAEPLYLTVAQMCEEAGVYFALNDKVPNDPEIKEQLLSMEYFAGAIAPANDVYGKILADYAIGQGWETCIATSSAEGDASDQPRLDAFKEAFTAAGGTIVAEVHSDTTADSLPNIQDALVANGEVDVIYGVGSDYAISACTALGDYPNFATKVITSGLDKEALDLLIDETSPLVMINGDYWVAGLFSAVVLQNAVEGNKLTDADGNAIWVDTIQPFEVSAENYGLYEKYIMNGSLYSAEEIQGMIGITYDEMIQIINDFNLDNRLQAKYEAGLISADEMAAAGYDVE